MVAFFVIMYSENRVYIYNGMFAALGEHVFRTALPWHKSIFN